MPQMHAERQKKYCEKQLQKYEKEAIKEKELKRKKEKKKQIPSWFGRKTE